MSRIEEFLVEHNLVRPKDRRRWRNSHEGGVQLTRRGALVVFGVGGLALVAGGAKVLSEVSQEQPSDKLQRWDLAYDKPDAVGQQKKITQEEWGLLDVSPVTLPGYAVGTNFKVLYLTEPFPATVTTTTQIPIHEVTGKFYGVHLHGYSLQNEPLSNQIMLVPDSLALNPNIKNLKAGQTVNPKEIDVQIAQLVEVDANGNVVYRGDYWSLRNFFIASKIVL